MARSLMLSLAFAVGCSGGAATKTETSTSAKAEAPKAPTAPVPPAPPAPPKAEAKPAAAPAKPVAIAADLSKAVLPTENAELFGFNEGEGHLFWYANGTITNAVKVPADGEYRIVVAASCQEAQGMKAKFKLLVDGQEVGGETTLTAEESREYAVAATLKAGDRKIGIQFTNDLYKENEYDLNLYVQALTVKSK